MVHRNGTPPAPHVTCGAFPYHPPRTDLLPAAIRDRRDTIGFAAPELRYLRGPLHTLLHDTLTGSQLAECGLVDEGALLAALASPQAGPPASHAAWKALSVELWLAPFGLTL